MIIFIALGNVTWREGLERSKAFLEKHFIVEIVLEPVPFKEDVLRSIINKNQDVYEIVHTPAKKGMERVDRLKYTGRGGVMHSRIHEEFGDESLERIKVNLSGLSNPVIVAFNKRGTITIQERNLTPQQLSSVLQLVVKHVITPYLSQSSFQQRLFS